MLKLLNLNLNLDLEGLTREETICTIAIIGNRLYKSGIFDKQYKLWKKFKNATRAKKFIKVLEMEKGIKLFSGLKNVYVSSRLI